MKDSVQDPSPVQSEAIHRQTRALLTGLASGYLASMLALAGIFLATRIKIDFAAVSGLALPGAAAGTLAGLLGTWASHKRGQDRRGWIYSLALGGLAGLIAAPATLVLLILLLDV